ncbi:flagellar biosynthetic protein FliO [Sphingosinicella terrae]|jgi:flagellar protein FliO/FliZ|uniref:flagellar biosynthetic protein FliO n=1 Tax=Sphingosinicella terrae TaxID=2172047 RepID=UPI000E0CDA69|nr:flagellar biosynthetic protein FliO [Sphingosinicella terrae]
MMTAYILRLLVLVPLVAGMAWLALWLWRKVQPGMALGQRERLVSLVDAVPLGATGRLAVVEFEGKRLLLAVSRGQIQLLTEAAIGSKAATDA